MRLLKKSHYRAYASKLVWADRSFSDCLAVLIAFKTWARHKSQGYFQRAVGGQHPDELERQWCFNRYLQRKVRCWWFFSLLFVELCSEIEMVLSFQALRDMEITINELFRYLKMMRIEKFVTPNRQPIPWHEKCR